MKTGNRWLIAGMTGALLLIPGAAGAQVPEVPVAPVPGGGSTAGPTGSFQPPAPIRAGQPLSVLVFPFGYAAAEAPAAPAEPPAAGEAAAAAELSLVQVETSNYLTAALKAGLLSSPHYAVATYHPQSSLIQRGRKDDILRPEHLTDLIAPATGAVDPEKARTIAYRLGMQSYMLGTIDAKEDPKTNTVEVTLDAQVLDSRNGQVLHSAVVTGAAVGAEGVPLLAVRERAAQEAALKAVPALGIQLVPLPSAQPPKAKANGKVKKTDAERKAEREAKKAADKAAKEEKARAREEEKARREAEKAERAGSGKTTSVQRDERGGGVLVAQAQPATPAPSPTVQPLPPAPTTVPGYTNAAGEPVPYGYALGETKEALPDRKKRRIRVPSWLGIGGFLAGLAILL